MDILPSVKWLTLVIKIILYELCFLCADAAEVPVVCVVLEGGPNTLETVRSAVDKGTPAVIVEVFHIILLDIDVVVFAMYLVVLQHNIITKFSVCYNSYPAVRLR